MRTHPLALLALLSTSAFANLVTDVRVALTHNDFPRATDLIRGYRASNGVTPEMLEALSWVARGELAAGRYDDAEKSADETYRLAVVAAKKIPLSRNASLATAVGAAIEVEANVLVAHHQRTEAVTYLHDQVKTYYATPIRARIQKDHQPADAGRKACAGARKRCAPRRASPRWCSSGRTGAGLQSRGTDARTDQSGVRGPRDDDRRAHAEVRIRQREARTRPRM